MASLLHTNLQSMRKTENQTVIVRVNGSIQVDQHKQITLEVMQEAIGGGFVECIGIVLYPELVMLIDEDGNSKNLQTNEVASSLAMRPIVGDVCIINRSDLK